MSVLLREVLAGDPATFEVLADVEYARDAKRVYVMGLVIPGADPKTFQIVESPYARDKSGLYCGNVRMNVDHIKKFQVVLTSTFWQGGNFGSTIIGQAWARDGENWYYGPDVVEGADYNSFKPIDGFYAEDKDQGYMGLEPVEKSDIPTWARDPWDQ